MRQHADHFYMLLVIAEHDYRLKQRISRYDGFVRYEQVFSHHSILKMPRNTDRLLLFFQGPWCILSI
jgi:hypothetical protein